MRFVWPAAALMLAACTDGEDITPVTEGSVVYPEMAIGVSQMNMVADSRAASPMSPDHEKYVKTIAVFEFDNEGLHVKSNNTYHFIDFVAGTVDGKTGVGDVHKTEYGIVETTLNGLTFEERSNGMICLVANITETDVDNFYNNYREDDQTYGNITFDKFKTWALPFNYVQSTSNVYDESTVGYLKDMYMFGYYEGPIEPATAGTIRIDLGRLASRLDIVIVNETGGDIDKRLGYHFDNVCHSAYFFPILSGMPPTIGSGLTRTVICAGENPVEGDPEFKIVPQTFPDKGVHTRYFYVAAHSAKDIEDATKLHLFYNRPIEDDNQDKSNSVQVPLCNVHPSEAAEVKNGYSLSRNTRYHFTIRLRAKASATSRSVEYTQPGEIIVYLDKLTG